MNPTRITGSNAVRVVLIGLGGAAVARGGYLVLFGMRPDQWIAIAIWLAAGSVVHDLLIAPVSLALGRLLRIGRPAVRRATGNPLRGLWLGLGSALLVGLPLLKGAETRRNPTVIPGRPVLNLVLSLALVIVGAGLMIAINAIRSRSVRPIPPHPTPRATLP